MKCVLVRTSIWCHCGCRSSRCAKYIYIVDAVRPFFVTFDCQCIQLLVRHKSAVWSPFLRCGCCFFTLDVIRRRQKKSQAKQQSRPSIWSPDSNSLAPCLYLTVTLSFALNAISGHNWIQLVSFLSFSLFIYLSKLAIERRTQADRISDIWLQMRPRTSVSRNGETGVLASGWCAFDVIEFRACITTSLLWLTTWSRDYWYSFSFIKKSSS